MNELGYLTRAFAGYPAPLVLGGLFVAGLAAWVISSALSREREEGRLDESTVRRIRREGGL